MDRKGTEPRAAPKTRAELQTCFDPSIAEEARR
jgi:hypothetical protein